MIIGKINKTIEYGLYMLVFLLPWQTRWIIRAGELNGGYSEYNTISLYITDILLLALLLLFMILKLQITNYKLQINPKLQIPIYWWIIAGLELFIFISIFFAPDKILAIYKYGVFLLGVGLFWLILSANYNKAKLIFSLLAGILIQAVLGIWQFLTQSSFSSKWLGIAAHRAGELGTSVVEIIAADGVAERWLRAYGGMDHPNVLGGVLVVGLLLVMLNAVDSNKKIKIFNFPQPRKTKRDKQFSIFKQFSPASKNEAGQAISNYLIILIFMLGLFFSFSRGAWLGVVVGFIVVFALLLLKKNLAGQKKFLEFALIGGVAIFLLFNLYGDLAGTRLKGGSRLEEKSYVERISYIKHAKEIIKDKWVFGAGIGNYTLEIKKREKNYRPSFYFQPVHNVFLLVWAEIGIFGMLFFVSLLFYACYSLLKGFKNNKDFNIYQIGLLAAMLVMFLVDHWWWSLHFGVLFFWLVIGLILREKDVLA